MHSPNVTSRRWLLRLAVLLLICLLALGGACRRYRPVTVDMGSSNDDVFLTSVLVVIGFVGLGLAASDVESGAAAVPDIDCVVTNDTDVHLALYADGRLIGPLEPGRQLALTLGAGKHELCWQAAGVDSGRQLRRELEIGSAPGYYTVALRTD